MDHETEGIVIRVRYGHSGRGFHACDQSIHDFFAGPDGPAGRDHTPRFPRRIGISYRAGDFEERDGVMRTARNGSPEHSESLRLLLSSSYEKFKSFIYLQNKFNAVYILTTCNYYA